MIRSSIFINHGITVFIISVFFLIGIRYAADLREQQIPKEYKILEPYLKQEGFDLSKPVSRTLFIGTVKSVYNNNIAKRDEILNAVEWYKTARFTDNILKSGNTKSGITKEKIAKYSGMFISMISVFLVLLFLVYRLSIGFGTILFIKKNSFSSGYLKSLIELITVSNHSDHAKKLTKIIKYLGKLFLSVLLYALLYSPAYVVAYSLKSGFDSGGYILLILFALLTNGLLISFSERFYHLLEGEAQKGYYQTAIVKNLKSDYSETKNTFFKYGNIFSLNPKYKGHVFHHIFVNARYQFFTSIKELSLFLVTGLIIIEMALNIQGHLFYSLLQDLLIHDYEMVLFTLYFLYLFIKVVELSVDALFLIKSKRFNNEF